jgi:hypothetical protein
MAADLIGDHRGDRRAGAGKGHVDDVDAGHLLEDFAGEMVRSPGSRRGIEQLPRPRAGERDVILERSGGHRGVHRQDHGIAGQQRHRREILARIVGHGHTDMRSDHDRGFRGHQQGVAVGAGFRHRRRPDPPCRAGAVVDEEGLIETLLEMRRQHERNQVGAATRGERHHDAHGTDGIGDLRRARHRHQYRHRSKSRP